MAELEERPSKIRKIYSTSHAYQDLAGNHASDSEPSLVKATSAGDVEPQRSNISAGEVESVGSGDDEEMNENAKSEVPLFPKKKGKQKNPPQLPNPLSKSQLKKARRKQEWEDGREERKAKRRERDKEKKARKAAETAAGAGPDSSETAPVPAQAKRPHQRPVQVPLTLLIDCDFDELMVDKEIVSLSSQLTRCYSDNRTSSFRSHLVVSSFRGQLKQRFETVLSSNHLGWKGVEFTDKDFVAAAQDAHMFMRSKEGGRIAGALAAPHEDTSAPMKSAVIADSSGHDVTEVSSVDVSSARMEDPGAIETVSVGTQIPEKNAGDAKQPSPPRTDSNGILSAATGQSDEVETSIEGSFRSADHSTKDAAENAQHSEPSIVYLSSDSEHTLSVLSPYTTYIIGGLVDKNRYKGVCYKRARERGIPTAKLPIGEYMSMQSRTVLTTNHVVEIMVRWLETGDWGKAFLQVIPKRKEAKLKPKKQAEGTDVSEVDRDADAEAMGGSEEHEDERKDEDEGGDGETGP
ncbi:MAG: tRNA (guanine(9)-N(1))-methyltransferase [Claussenomyces sp. TS43310]|nr:MAG: tRNA (guanine(9)-N(1))-methyltransferase [Claussenomyces sp. TS43310]